MMDQDQSLFDLDSGTNKDSRDGRFFAGSPGLTRNCSSAGGVKEKGSSISLCRWHVLYDAWRRSGSQRWLVGSGSLKGRTRNSGCA